MSYFENKSDFKTNKMLAQAVGTVTPTSIYQVPTDFEAVVTQVLVANTSPTAKDFTIYLDDDGTTYNSTTTIFNQIDVPKNSTVVLDIEMGITNPVGNLAIESSANNSLTFTVFGYEIEII